MTDQPSSRSERESPPTIGVKRCRRCGTIDLGGGLNAGKCGLFVENPGQRDYHDFMPMTLVVRDDLAYERWAAANAKWRERGW